MPVTETNSLGLLEYVVCILIHLPTHTHTLPPPPPTHTLPPVPHTLLLLGRLSNSIQCTIMLDCKVS